MSLITHYCKCSDGLNCPIIQSAIELQELVEAKINKGKHSCARRHFDICLICEFRENLHLLFDEARRTVKELGSVQK